MALSVVPTAASRYLATGWLGETYKPGQQPKGNAADPSGMKVISWDPRIFHYRRFLTDGECICTAAAGAAAVAAVVPACT